MKYAEKLKDPRWQRKRLEILNRDNFTCQECDSTDKTLHVHHLRYKKKADPWDYDTKELVTLCHECHEYIDDFAGEAFSILQDACNVSGFSATSVYNIASGIQYIGFYNETIRPKLLAEAISWMLRDTSAEDLVEIYLTHKQMNHGQESSI